MKRDIHLKNNGDKKINDKIMSYIIMGAIVLAIIVISLLLYSQKINKDVKEETISLGKMANIIGENDNKEIENIENENKENENKETESASTQIGKTVEQSKEENQNKQSSENNSKVNNSNNTTTPNIDNKTKNNTNQTTTNKQNTDKQEKQIKELAFQKPVNGEIVKEFAQDKLIYSKTLEEWVTHNGIDIKAEKTTVVKAAEAGVVKTIKNDPRYGLTIVIEHNDAYQTVYSNLLTSEFVVEGEKVEKGQSIGTVGNSSVFESADEPHLHFEILKNSIQVNPTIYIK